MKLQLKAQKFWPTSFEIPDFPKVSCGLDWIFWWVASGPHAVRWKPLLYMEMIMILLVLIMEDVIIRKAVLGPCGHHYANISNMVKAMKC